MLFMSHGTCSKVKKGQELKNKVLMSGILNANLVFHFKPSFAGRTFGDFLFGFFFPPPWFIA